MRHLASSRRLVSWTGRATARNEESLGESVGDMARFHDLSDGPLLHNLRKARDSAVERGVEREESND